MDSDPQPKTLSRDSRLFAQKAARSIVEIERNVNNVADIMVLLDVLGYNDKISAENGYENLYDLAKNIQGFIENYDDKEKNTVEIVNTFDTPLPTKKNLFSEGIGMMFPWIGSLILLYTSGVSLWMTWGLPPQITTAFIIGVFFGLGITEGFLQTFGRLFTLYYRQENIGEVRRVISRSYITTCSVLAVIVVSLYLVGNVLHIPLYLVGITLLSLVTVSIHRISYLAIYAWKKLNYLVISYSGAFASMLSVYYFSSSLIIDETTRYFVALGTSFIILMVFALHYHLKVTSTKLKSPEEGQPHFFKPITIIDKTLKSRFHVQFWETLPYFLLGTFYFSMLFSDRVMAWIFNPDKVILSTGYVLPMTFNPIYHIGADLALFVLLPTGIIQYIMMSPIFVQLRNMTLTRKTIEIKAMDEFLYDRYKKVIMVTLISSVSAAGILYFVGPQIITYVKGSELSVRILHMALLSNVVLSIFGANSIFIALVNKTKILAILAIMGTAIICLGTLVVIQNGFQNITITYLGSALLSAILSTIYVRKILKNATSRFFAKYV